MRSPFIITGDVGVQSPPQVRFAYHDDVVETFPSDRPDQSLRKAILPRRAAGDGFVTDAHGSHPSCDHCAVDAILVTNLRTEIYESAPLFKADNATLSFYPTKDDKISVS